MYCRELLKRPEEESNVYAAMTTAVLFAERNRNDNAEQILSRCQEANRNDPAILYNKALIEYIKGKHPASLTILSSHNNKHSSNSLNNRVSILMAINNFTLKNFDDAYKGFSSLVRDYPHDPKHLYNYASYLHQYAQYTFKLQGRDAHQTGRSLQYLEKARQIFEQVSKHIGLTY
jgi:outer membrane protein assembly factor BamD (BamD/ComL family)